MVRRPSRREFLAATGSALAIGLAGCSAPFGLSSPTVDSSLGTTAYDPVLDAQPTFDEGVPAVWGMLFSHPDVARKLIDWRALVSDESTVVPGSEFRSFDPDEQFASVVIGVLPTGYGLTGYERESGSVLEDVADDFRQRPSLDRGRLRYEVTPYRAFSPDPGVSENHYDYTFTLWNRNGSDRPDEIVVDLRETDSLPE